MNPEVKDKWLKALRSNDYKQGIGCLRDKHNNFCCLGVLCDLYSKEFDVPWNFDGYLHTIIGEVTVLPYKVTNWADLTYTSPIISSGQDLAILNDSGVSFKDIADMIERDL